jgi:NAD(P)-dependent dehydrogenase (short-subunit alcohol dehydrogenase family)
MSTPDTRVAVVTGASAGIGKACAQALLQQGWNTVFISRQQQALEDAISAAGATRGHALAVSCDVTDAGAVQACFEQAARHFGRIALLFNNAGRMGPAGRIDELELDAWERTLDVNVKGAFNSARAAFSQMRRQQPQGGRIINNGSIAAHTPRPRTVPYTMTKHAITGLTKCLSLDGREFDIVCGQIDIGNVLTDMTQSFTQGMLQADGERRAEPVFDLRHVVDAVLYMANLPLQANVQFMTVMASKMPFIGRG